MPGPPMQEEQHWPEAIVASNEQPLIYAANPDPLQASNAAVSRDCGRSTSAQEEYGCRGDEKQCPAPDREAANRSTRRTGEE